jgi:hypothetical protein
MCKEMPVISVNRVVDPKRIIGKYGGLRRRRGTRGRGPPKKVHDIFNKKLLKRCKYGAFRWMDNYVNFWRC